MEKTVVATNGGIGIGGLVFVILLVLKLTGSTSMSWLLVLTSIIWAPALAFIGILAISLFIIAMIFVAAAVASLFMR